jgi:carboxypeptidase family protein
MTKAKFALCVLAGLIVLMLLPSMAMAQSTIEGQVRDTSGAVIANATVEVSSDALIEGKRTVTTNGEGRYAIIDLRPGTYVVTVTMSGFATEKQTILLPANVSVPVDAQLKVGAVGETVNVEARVATVDTENVSHSTTLSRSDMDELPTGRYMQSIASYAPGAHLNLPDIGGSQQVEQNYISLHGNNPTQNQYVLDGMLINTTYLDGAIQNYLDNAAVQETTNQSSLNSVEYSGGGMAIALVPRDGGNLFHTDVFLSGSAGTGIWQANNLNATTLARSLANQDKTVKIEDFDGDFSGPLIKDKLWFNLTGRDQTTFTQAGDSVYPNGSPGIQNGYIYSGSFRLTYQMNQKNKFSAFLDRNWKYKGHEILDGGAVFPYNPAVSAQQRNKWPMYYIVQGRWTYTATNKLVFETGFSIDHLDYNDLYQSGVATAEGTPAFDPSTVQIDLGYPGNGGTGTAFVAGTLQEHFQTTRNVYTEQAAYITGSHQFKAGFQFSNGRNDYAYTANGDGREYFEFGTPVEFLAFNTPIEYNTHLDADAAFYGMDTWKIKRLSITAGIRWEYLSANIDPENASAGRFAPARTVPNIDCNTIKGMGCWSDWVPRVGAVYDLFGNHKTALKAGIGKFDSQYSSSFTGNFNPMSLQSEAVPWNTAGLGAACTPVNFSGLGPGPNPACFATGGFAPQGTVGTGGVAAGALGASPNPTFGLINAANPTLANGVALDPNWHRDYNWQYSLGVQHELYPGITLNFNWFRRSIYQGTNLVNYSSPPLSAWTPVTINNPLNGTPITLYNLNPSVTSLAAPALYQTNAPQSLVRDTYMGYEFQTTGRLKRGIFFTFGYTIERQMNRNCDLTVGLSTSLEDPNNLRYCDWFGNSNLSFQGINIASLGSVGSPPWANNFVGNAVIPVRWGIVGSVSFVSNNYQGNIASSGNGAAAADVDDGYLPRTISINSAKSSVYPNGCVGCMPAGNPCAAGFVVGCPIDPGYNALEGAQLINLIAPGAYRSPRVNQLDISISRRFRIKERWILEPKFQLFNLLNSNAAISQTTAVPVTTTSTGTAPFLTPQQCVGSPVASIAQCGLGGNISTITNPRLMKLALTIRF